MEPSELMKKRHSVRQYRDLPIEKEKREVLNELVDEINREADLNIRIFYDEPKCFDSFRAHYGKFSGVKNYIALVGKRCEDIDEKLGYYGEKLVIKATELGLQTCWVALTHGKSAAKAEKGEKKGCLISLGYGCTTGTPHKSKSAAEVSAPTEDAPAWFREGVEAALLAPTAMNQQKFFFSLSEEGNVVARPGKGFYTRVDLGIAAYHFEAVTGKRVEYRKSK